MSDCPIIGILVPNRNKRKKILKLYQRHHNLPLKLFAFTRAGILWEKHKIIGLCQIGGKWEEKMFPFPHAVYNRCYNKKTTTIEHLNSIIGGEKCFNGINWFNKWKVYNLLIKSNLQMYIPDTFLLNEVNLSELVKKYKMVYMKPSYGNRGKNVYRLELKENGDIHISLHSLAPRLICRKNENIQQKLDKLIGENIFIVQKGIQASLIDNKNYDIRVLVQKDINGKWNVTTMVCRVANQLYFNTGVYESLYDAAEILDLIFPLKKTKETTINSINKISVNAAQVLETNMGLLGELSVDFVLDEKMNLWIIELNGKPQKNIYKDINKFKHEQLIYRRPIEYAYYLSIH
ncbi:YheC/YheD family endospore coat-associated protein [Alkaliphilus peptidifermentans]|uniref:YheC/D like ATP-grasp n=1 Tax=Alkaliphilus peptidifermentans DSM 18978 TaxID=1120976 RepID=A0A1G5E601_9FIRM|nr:YheC/YheD family protein [Alkaliphilus peptidifermentans]SCY22345.1 YheC/D like ATP-grasp [Alkaliphilus peptidifermentans DSM 18978]